MARLFSSDANVSEGRGSLTRSGGGGVRPGNVSGYQSNGPEMRSDAGSPHAADSSAGTAPVGGQYTQPSAPNTGGNSFLQKAQMKQGKPEELTPEEEEPLGEMRDTSLDPGPAMLPPGSGTGAHSASGASPSGANSAWTWTATAGNAVPNTPSYGGAAYNGGGPLASGISNPNAPRAAIGSGKVIQGTVEP